MRTLSYQKGILKRHRMLGQNMSPINSIVLLPRRKHYDYIDGSINFSSKEYKYVKLASKNVVIILIADA